MRDLCICRLCLIDNVPMYTILNTQLQEIYEKLSNYQLITSNNSPILVCYMCYAELGKCLRLKDKCQRSEEALQSLLISCGGLLTKNAIKKINRKAYNLSNFLVVTPVENVDIISTEDVYVDIKVEKSEQHEVSKSLNVADSRVVHVMSMSDNDDHFDAWMDIGILNEDKDTNHKDKDKDYSLRVNNLVLPNDKILESCSSSDENVPLAQCKKNVSLKRTGKRKGKKKDKEGKDSKRSNIKSVRSREEIDTTILTAKRTPRKFVKWWEQRPDGEVLQTLDCDYAREVILTEEQQLQEVEDRKLSSNYISSPFKCNFCYRGYVDARAYDNHMDRHSEKSGSQECPTCRMRFPSTIALNRHRRTHHFRRFLCNYCSYKAPTPHKAKLHNMEHKGHKYPCDQCGKQFKRLSNYLFHIRKLHPTDVVCGHCGESFASRRGLKFHVAKAGHQPPPAADATDEAEKKRCEQCNVTFETSSAWKRHFLLSRIHAVSNELGKACPICDAPFDGNAKAHLSEHARELNCKRTVSCNQCDKTFSTVSKLGVHLKTAHAGLRNGSAEEGAGGVGGAAGEGAGRLRLAGKEFMCEMCGKPFADNFRLAIHQRTHTGEKPFCCGICGKKVTSKASLQIHLRTHSGARPYACATCGHAFSQRSSYNRHQLVHSGLKPFQCSACPKAFTQSNSLGLHVRTVHLKLPPKYKRSRARKPDLD